MFTWIAFLASVLLLPIKPIPGIRAIADGFGEASDPQESSVPIESPRAVAVDKEGNLYIADQSQHRVLRMERSGCLTVIAGTGKEGFGGDGGPPTQAFLAHPGGLAVDAAGNLFIADSSNNRIRRVDAKTGTISTAAGDGAQAFSGDGGPASRARLDRPGGVVVDQFGNLSIADTWNHRVRRVEAATGIITTVAGNGTREYGGDGGPATQAGLGYVTSLALDKSGNLYIRDGNNHRVRRVDAATHVITTVAGDGSLCYRGDGGLANSTGLPDPSAVAVDANLDLFIADTFRNTVHRVDSATGVITTVAGNGLRRFAGDGGPAIEASLAAPTDIALDSSGNLYIADIGNHRVRRIDARTGVISTVLGDGNEGFPGALIATDDEMTPFAPVFLDFSEYLNRFKILKQLRISPEYSVALIKGSTAHADILCVEGKLELLKQEAHGIFITNDSGKDLVLFLDVFPSPSLGDTEIGIQEVGERSLIISKKGETYGQDFERVKYFYDLPSRKLIKKISYHAMSVYSAVEFQDSLFFIGSADRETSIVTRMNHGVEGDVTGTRILEKIRGEPIARVLRVRADGQELVLSSEQKDYVFSANTWSAEPMPAREFHELKPYLNVIPYFTSILSLADATRLSKQTIELGNPGSPTTRLLVCGYPLCDPTMIRQAISGVYEITAGDSQFHALPQPDYDTFQRYRPIRTTQGYTRKNTTIEEGIGPFQLVGDKVWFGMSFYDGEGMSGVGGLGHFDISTKQFQVHYYPEIADWSASAILVEDRHIWLGLFGRPEGAPYPGGLARFDRQQGTFRVIEIPPIVNKIMRVGEVLYLATAEGIYFLRSDELTHLDFVVDVKGKYSLEVKSAPLSFAR